jgi:hypothetical protein
MPSESFIIFVEEYDKERWSAFTTHERYSHLYKTEATQAGALGKLLVCLVQDGPIHIQDVHVKRRSD